MRSAVRYSGLRRGVGWGSAMSEKRGPVIAVVAVLALLGWRMLPSSGPAPDSGDKTQSAASARGEKAAAASAEGTARTYEFTRPLEAVRSTEVTQPLPEAASDEQSRGPIGAKDWKIRGWDVDFLIATVPDPVDATVLYRFHSA